MKKLTKIDLGAFVWILIIAALVAFTSCGSIPHKNIHKAKRSASQKIQHQWRNAPTCATYFR